MVNEDLAKIFFEIGHFLDLKGEEHKPRVYQAAACFLDTYQIDLIEIYRSRGTKSLMQLPGIGDSIAQKIEEYFLTGRIQYYEELKQEFENKKQ